ncbi:MAG TPA: metallophosphoesterase [Gaiellaceae bacterium]|nr:metallophosphoesterase [Gaiellaceae bacterium]
MRLRVRELPIPGLPPELDGLRIAHLSDFHLGVPSRGKRAVEKAIDWVVEREPDLVCVTGDLLSRPGGEPHLLELLARIDHPYIVLGNHDYAISRDPFSKPVELSELENGTILFDETVRVGEIELGGVDPRSWMERRPSRFADSAALLRILLCHFPEVLDRVPDARWHLILSGHLHAGQIVLPYGFGKVYLAHPRAKYPEGVFERNGTVLHVSPGLGTTFIPLRFFARPEVTELVLRSG